jgi:cell division protein FtsL
MSVDAMLPTTRPRGLLWPLLLASLTMISALIVVSVKHQNRSLTAKAENLRKEHDRLEAESSQLQLERASRASYSRIEILARDQLGMSEPRDYVVVEQPTKRSAP